MITTSLAAKTALVTGASRGIGLAITKSFLEHGATVHALSRSQVDPATVSAADSERLIHHPVDVSDETAVGRVVTTILDQSESVDILVNNAGITRDGLIMRMSTDDWRKVLDVNLSSAFFTSRALARHMIKRRSGCIINVSSVVGVIGNPGQANYVASKAGLIGLTKSLARELAGRSVRVNAVAPGFIATAMTDRLNGEQRSAISARIPLQRIGTPQEVAAVCLFLASDLSSYVTGQVLHVDGGLAM